jgi:hypothetical protein
MDLPDFTSGYRAYTRAAAMCLHAVYGHTYTVETLVQASHRGLNVEAVPIRVRERQHGQSRMTKSVLRYIVRAGGHAFRTVLHENPLRSFLRAAAIFGVLSLAFIGWFLIDYAGGGLHLPLLLGALLLVLFTGGLTVSGLVADGISVNRRLTEEVLTRIKRLEYDGADVGAVLRDGLAAPGARSASVVIATPQKSVRDDDVVVAHKRYAAVLATDGG